VNEERQRFIGGSDIAAICGLSPWKTAFQVWQEKVGESEGQSDNDAMAYGRLMESVIRQWYSNETGRVVVVPDTKLIHPKYPFICASLDGIADMKRIVEIKTTRSGSDWGEPGSDEIPVYYRLQVEQYMMITKLEVADVPVSVAGSIPVIYEVEADIEIQEMIVEQAVLFWGMVQRREPPELVGIRDVVAKFGRSSMAGLVTATQDTEMAVAKIKQIREEIDKLKSEEDALKFLAMKEIGEKDTLTAINGSLLATWKMSRSGKKFDEASFKKDNPELYAKYLNDKPGSRKFLLK